MKHLTRVGLAMSFLAVTSLSAHATTKGLSQIVTPDLQEPGDLSLSLQIQDKRIANPYQLQAEMGFTKWVEAAVFRGFDPDEWDMPPKPKWMRWRTYDRAMEKFDRYESTLDEGVAGLAARFGIAL